MNITFDFKEFKEFLEGIYEFEYGRCGDSLPVDYDIEGDLVVRQLRRDITSNTVISREVSLRGVVQE